MVCCHLFGYITDDHGYYILPTKNKVKTSLKYQSILCWWSINLHRIDGLIYLPVKLSVKGSVKGIQKQSISERGNVK